MFKNRQSPLVARTVTYTYDADGNVESITDARGITRNYTYDAQPDDAGDGTGDELFLRYLPLRCRAPLPSERRRGHDPAV